MAENGNGTVDTQGLLMAVKVLKASLGDREGGRELLLPLAGQLPRLQVIWVDSGYAGDPFKHGVKQHLGVRLEMAKHRWTGLRGCGSQKEQPSIGSRSCPRAFISFPGDGWWNAPTLGSRTAADSLAILRARIRAARLLFTLLCPGSWSPGWLALTPKLLLSTHFLSRLLCPDGKKAAHLPALSETLKGQHLAEGCGNRRNRSHRALEQYTSAALSSFCSQNSFFL
jgi:hypothetical protein